MAAKPWSEEHELHKRHMFAGRVCHTKRSPKLSEANDVDVADIWGESKRSYLGRSDRYAVDLELEMATHAAMRD